MSIQQQTPQPVVVEVEPQYLEHESRPEAQEYLFAYRVRIRNHGPTSVQVLSRHWIITDGFGHVEEVRGSGVVGMQPHILPGQAFEYESACPLPTSTGSMHGYYYMITDTGDNIMVAIPEFFLIAPQALH